MQDIDRLTSDSEIFEIIETPESINMLFSSAMDNVDRACNESIRFLMDFFQGLDCAEEIDCYEGVDCSECFRTHIFSIQLVMREGLTNAVRHGNRLNVLKKVRCSVQVNPEQVLHIEIEDEGKGFNWAKEQNKDISEMDDSLDHGRGLVIMEQYFSRYWYNESGNKLVLEKQIPLKP
ncbi:MAG: ATP-binding protein [Desulfamplus sp.]|nr:ATP-binding protein [Desulfamplus sp.]